jgi:hypothetical protein
MNREAREKTLHLHIDRIVVEGLPEKSQRQFESDLKQQLREWALAGIADQFRGNTRQRISSLSAGTLRPGATAAQAAARIVGSMGRGISGKGTSHA